jgi:hypothetical protein
MEMNKWVDGSWDSGNDKRPNQKQMEGSINQWTLMDEKMFALKQTINLVDGGTDGLTDKIMDGPTDK